MVLITNSVDRQLFLIIKDWIMSKVFEKHGHFLTSYALDFMKDNNIQFHNPYTPLTTTKHLSYADRFTVPEELLPLIILESRL